MDLGAFLLLQCVEELNGVVVDRLVLRIHQRHALLPLLDLLKLSGHEMTTLHHWLIVKHYKSWTFILFATLCTLPSDA